MLDQATPAPALAAERVSKSYGGVVALADASIALVPGEIVGLVGDNGAGKSTLVKILSGVVSPDGGRVLVDGGEVAFGGPAGALEAGIETVYQDLALVDTLPAAPNVYLGREELSSRRLLRWLNVLDARGMRRRTGEVLEELGVKVPSMRSDVKRMSGGQRQCLAIARAMLWGRRVVILDEPTAALGVRESAHVLEVTAALRERGVAVLMIAHNMQHLFEVADRITVMRLGRSIAELQVRETTPPEVVGLITGALDPGAVGAARERSEA